VNADNQSRSPERPVRIDAVNSPEQTATAEARRSLTAEGVHRAAFTPADWALFLGPAVIWGASFLFIAEGLESLKPGVVTFLRMVFGFAALALVPGARAPIPRHEWKRIAAVSITWLAFPMTLFPIAQQHVSSSLAGMLNGGIPIFAAIVATILLRRLPGRWQQLGLLTGIVGIVCIGLPTVNEGSSSAFGVLLVVIAIASYGVAVNLAVPLTQTYGSVPVFWRCQMISVVLTAPFGFWGMRTSSFEWRPVGAVILLGVFGTATAFVMMTKLGARVGSTRSSTVTYLEAIIALGIGVAVRNDKVTAVQLVGCVILIAGAWMASRQDA
jgi:drug/metabolite transporter (DMT)-like permease